MASVFKCFVLGLICFVISSCGKKDEEKIIGKWQCDQLWFEFHPDQTYSGGTSILTEVKGFKYSLSSSDHELNLYTKEDNNAHYLNYSFRGNDTLVLTNKLSTVKHEIIYVRTQANF